MVGDLAHLKFSDYFTVAVTVDENGAQNFKQHGKHLITICAEKVSERYLEVARVVDVAVTIYPHGDDWQRPVFQADVEVTVPMKIVGAVKKCLDDKITEGDGPFVYRGIDRETGKVELIYYASGGDFLNDPDRQEKTAEEAPFLISGVSTD